MAAVVYLAILEDGGNDDVETATVPQAATTEPEPAATAEPEPVATEPEPAENSEPAASEPEPAESSGPQASNQSPPWLVPWGDGFMAITTEPEEVPFPELSDEQSELFPEEVQELFAERPPDSVAEATQRVIEAGLSAEVLAVFEEHPDLEKLITGTQSRILFEAWVTDDGTDWEPADIDFAIAGFPSMITSDGTTLAVITEYRPAEPDAESATITVATSDDLQEWEVQTITEEPAATPEWVDGGVYLTGFALGSGRWVAAIAHSSHVDPLQLLPEEEAEALMGTGFALSTSAEGIHISTEEDCPPIPDAECLPEAQTYTWTELGIDQATFDAFMHGETSATIVSASVSEDTGGGGGGTTSFDVPDAVVESLAINEIGSFALLSSSGDGTPRLLRSQGGITWDPLPLPPMDRYGVAGIWSVDDGLLLAGNDAYLSPPDGSEWSPTEFPEELEEGQFSFIGPRTQPTRGLALAIEATAYGYIDPPVLDVTIEAQGGYELNAVSNPEHDTVTLTASGVEPQRVLAVSVVTFPPHPDDSTEAFTFHEDGLIQLTDVSIGEVVASFSIDQIIIAQDAALEGMALEDTEFALPESKYALVATTDAKNWLVEPIDSDPNTEEIWMVAATINGNRVLLSVGGATELYELP